MNGLLWGVPSKPFIPVLSDVYTGKGTAALGVADTGQGWAQVMSSAPARLTVIGGKLTNTANAASGQNGYVIANLGARVLRIGGRVTFSNVAVPGGGCAAFVIWQQQLMDKVQPLPNSGFHLVVGPLAWSVGVFVPGPTYVVLAQASFAVPLVADGMTASTVDVTIAGNVATITLPDGPHVVTDARITTYAGPFACFEVSQSDASADTKAGFSEVWASV